MNNSVRYSVKWCYNIPLKEDGSDNFDKVKFTRNFFKDHDSAKSFAIMILNHTCKLPFVWLSEDKKFDGRWLTVRLKRFDEDDSVESGDAIEESDWEDIP